MGEKEKYSILVVILITTLMVGSVFAGATAISNSISRKDDQIGARSSDYFYIDFNKEIN